MSKQTGAYESLIKGVSEQVAHQRYPGQHWDQLNMVSDPVRGLARRAGSTMVHERLLTGVTRSAATIQDCRNFREQSLYLGSNEYSISFRGKVRVNGSTMPGLVVFDKSAGAILPVNYSTADSKLVNSLITGINSVTSVGKFVLLAAKTVSPTYTTKDLVNDNDGIQGAVAAWIKGGSYSRTYTLSVKSARTGQVFTVQYTTKASYYPGTLDTSDIPATVPDPADPAKTIPNPNYQKLVNDRVYAYQTAVNQWIGDAAADIAPANIAQGLVNALFAAGAVGIGIARLDSHICMTDVSAISIDDGGDGSQAVAVGKTVTNVADLTTKHYPGKVVRVQPQNGNTKAYYVRAVQKVGTASDFQDVTWEESPGILVTPVFVTLIGCVVGGQFWVASTPEILQSIAGVSVPRWEPSSSGDLESQAVPTFLSGEIHYLRMFQDRLMIVRNGTVFLSRSGDYFNFFRVGALNVQDNDPIEIFALGSEDDIITSGTMLDKNLILFGKQWQYSVPGGAALTPSNAFVAVQSSYKDTNECDPESSGGLIFFAQQRDGKLTINQMQTGAYADTLLAYEITQQLNSFLKGAPSQIVAVTSPNALAVRTSAEDYGFWIYSYLDSAGQSERLFDSWSKWQFSSSLGNIVSMCTKDGYIYVTTLRQAGSSVYMVVDRFTLHTDPEAPHLDSRRNILSAGTLAQNLVPTVSQYAGAYNENSGRYYLVGDTYANNRLTSLREQVGSAQDANLEVGALFDAYVVPTSPYIRDRNGQAILDSRLTLGSMAVTVFQSSALDVSIADLVDADPSFVQTQRWVARAANSWTLNTQEVKQTASVPVAIFKEIREFKVKLASRSWLPLTISSIEWTGQFFTRRRG